MKLTKAHQLLSDKSKWIQDGFARDADDNSSAPMSPYARKFCAWGAIECVYEGEASVPLKKIRDEIERMGFPRSIVKWNDAPERTFQEVRELLVKLDI